MAYLPNKTGSVRTTGQARKEWRGDSPATLIKFALAFAVMIAGVIGLMVIFGR